MKSIQTANKIESNPETNLVWIDLEMTGFTPNYHKIIQIATVITNKNLDIVAISPELIINQPEDIISRMDRNDKVINSFFESGFVDKVRKSELTIEDAEEKTLEFIKKHVAEGVSPLCGNSVHTDRFFIIKQMPKLNSYLHYRNLDVTTVKLLSNLWTDIPSYQKKEAHQALDDIKESIEQLKYYKQNFFKI